MKSSYKLFALLGAVTALATIASADTVTFGPDNAGLRVGVGGEFTIFVNGTDPQHLTAGYAAAGTSVAAGSFQTFCIQYNEEIAFGGTYNYAISDSAKGPTGTDPISLGTAYLYSLFATHTLSDYDYTIGSGRSTDAGLLQNAFWYLEDEISIPDNVNNIYLTDAIAHFGSLTAAKADANGAFGVKVLNLGAPGVYEAQDQLVWPEPSKVPDATSTFGLLALAFAGLVGFRRRFSK